ncbi:MAG: DUF3794 domain-containing protein [Clostridia bacterium]|nr:DUF3794 domain-containing protein [Clostridia bacterium]
MAIKTDKELLKLDKIIARNTQILWLEQDLLVPDSKPDVMKIVQVEAVPYIANTDVYDGGIRVSGEITYYIIYRSMDEDKTRGITATYPFTQSINVPEVKKNMKENVRIAVRNIVYSLPNERKIGIKLELVYKYVVKENTDVSIITGMEGEDDIESKNVSDTFYNVIDVKDEIIDTNEDIIMSDSTPKIGEILRVGAGITNTDYKVSYNKILVKGDISLEVMYVEQDTNNVFTYTTEVPFAGMIEFENIKEEYKWDIKYALRNLELTLNENNILNAKAEINVNVVLYEEKEITYIKDFYSTKSNLKYDAKDVVIVKNKDIMNKTIAIKENVGVTDIKNKVATTTVSTEQLNAKVVGENLYVDGVVKLGATFVNQDTGVLENKTYDLLVDTTIPLGKDVKNENVDVTINVISKAATNINGNVEANINLEFVVTVENVDKVILIDEITDEDVKDDALNSMYVYIIKKGDTLWDIAKKYKTTVDKIANTNNITDENKLDIGQKILIIR